MKKLSKRDYKKITKFYKSKKHTRKNALKTISRKFCSCVEKVKVKKKGEAIGICTKSVINRKGFKRGKFSCKRKPSIQLYKGGKRHKKTRKKIGGSPLPPVPYKDLKLTHPLLIRNNGDRVYDMKNKKNNVVQKVRITEKLERDGKKMIKFQRVKQLLDGSPGLPSVISGRYEGYTPYGDHTGPWTYITPYDEVILTKHISTAKAVKLAAGIGLFGGRRKKKTRKKKGGMTLEEIDNRINVLREALTYWSNVSDNHPSTIDERILTIFKIRYELDKLLLLKEEGRDEGEEEGRDEPNLKKRGGRRKKKTRKRRRK